MAENFSERIEKIEGIGKGAPAKPRAIPNHDHFEALMQQGQSTVVSAGAEPTSKVSFMDEVRRIGGKIESVTRATPEVIRSQAQDLITQIDALKEQLSVPKLEIKNSVQNLLRNKLTHIDDNLRIALTKAGVEYTPAEKISPTENPIVRFVGYLTHAQYQLQHLGDTIEQLQLTRKELTPANMLSIQIKVGYVQQEIEFFTSLLNKALESTKTIMNVQV